MAEDIKALDGVYNFSDARRAVEEVLAIQQEIAEDAATEEMRAFLAARVQMASAISMLLEDEGMMQHYLSKADEREDAARA